MLATLLFSSNILFAGRSGYFDAPAETRPLLHTWSLSVEEQFYICYPLFLFLVARYFHRRYAVAIAAAALASFAWSVRLIQTNAVDAFFLSPPRVWELLVGALLAVGVIPRIEKRLTATLAGIVGLLAIAYGVLRFSPDTAFPGLNALFPVLGAAFVIHSAAASPVIARTLSARPLVFVGLISYSLYLWHWVLIVLARRYFVRPMTWAETTGIVLLSFVMAVLSWQFVERPLRERRFLPQRARLAWTSAGAAFVLGAFAWMVFITEIVPRRLTPGAKNALAAKSDIWPRVGECFDKVCRVGADAVRPTFMLWGDSHGNAIAPALEDAARRMGMAGFVATKAACIPLLGIRRYDRFKVDCRDFADSVLRHIRTSGVQTVFLHGRWAPYVELRRYGGEWGSAPQITASGEAAPRVTAFDKALRSTLAALQSLRVNIIIVASVPEIAFNVPDVMARAAQSGRSIAVAPRVQDYLARQSRTFDVLKRAAAEHGARIVYPHELLCSAGTCAVMNPPRLLYFDDDHLTVFGAMKLSPMFERVLQGGRELR
jgi:hypothetical protein